jgi:phospholipid/cholesterol/gamma-HCH transport system substrate-binding protein
MPTRYAREAIVGTLVLLAIATFVVGTMWLSGRSLGGRKLVKARFENSSGIKRASPVTISGVQVGRVEKIELADVGKVVISMSIPTHIQPKLDASAQIAAVGLVGDYVVEFDPGHAPEPLPPDQVVVGRIKTGFSDRASSLGDRADSVLLGLQQFANKETAEDFRQTLRSLQQTLRAAERTMRVYGDRDRGPTAELTQTMAALRHVTNRFDSTLGNPALGRTLNRVDSLSGNLATMTQQLTVTSARLDTVLSNVTQGKGTIGKFATDSGLYTDLRDLSGAMKGLIGELRKNPGKIGVTVKIF